MTKPILDERFADWVDGRLKPAERALLEAEMIRDPALAQAAEDYRRTVQLLRGALAPPVLEGSIADRVLARIEPAPPARPRLTIRPIFASVIAAAALLLAFVIVRAIPPAPTVDVTETAKRDADDVAVNPQLQAAPAPEAVQPAREAAPAAPGSEAFRVAVGGAAGEGDAGKNEAWLRALTSVAEGVQVQAVREGGTSGEEGVSAVAKEKEIGEEGTGASEVAKLARSAPPPGAATEYKGGEKAAAKPAEEQKAVGVVDESRMADDRSTADDRPKDRAPPADSNVAVPLVFEEQAARWTAGLGELALVVEPGATDARTSNPLLFFSQFTQTRGASLAESEAKTRAEPSGAGEAARPGTQLGFEVREVRLGEADRRDALAADDQFFLGGQPRTPSVPTDRVFVVSGTAAAMRVFARDLQAEVAAHDGKVLVERSQQLAKVLEAEQVRARRVATAQPTPAGPATPGPGTTGRGAPAPKAGPTSPGSAAPGAGGGVGDRAAAATRGDGAPERIELHVIVRARRPGGGR